MRPQRWRVAPAGVAPPLHAHGFIASIHVNDLSGDGRRAGAREENARVAEFVGMATPLSGACSS